jgi:hypothetical protein
MCLTKIMNWPVFNDRPTSSELAILFNASPSKVAKNTSPILRDKRGSLRYSVYCLHPGCQLFTLSRHLSTAGALFRAALRLSFSKLTLDGDIASSNTVGDFKAKTCVSGLSLRTCDCRFFRIQPECWQY